MHYSNKNRFFAFVLTLAMVFMTMPAMAGISIEGNDVKAGDTYEIKANLQLGDTYQYEIKATENSSIVSMEYDKGNEIASLVSLSEVATGATFEIVANASGSTVLYQNIYNQDDENYTVKIIVNVTEATDDDEDDDDSSNFHGDDPYVKLATTGTGGGKLISDADNKNILDADINKPSDNDENVVEAATGDTYTLYFKDVHPGDWFYPAVMNVAKKGIMKGFADDTFRPYEKYSRIDVLKSLAVMAGKDNLTDKEILEWAMAEGITDGTVITNPALREQVMAMIHRFDGNETANADLSVYSDSKTISAWALSEVKWAVAKGVAIGYEDYTIRPINEVNRAEAAQFFYAYIEGK